MRLRNIAFRLATSDALENLVRRSDRLETAAYSNAKGYVGGRTLEEALRTVERLTGEGFAVSLDLFGEDVSDPKQVDDVLVGYLEAARSVSELSYDIDLEVVPSHLGIDESVDFFCRHVGTIADGFDGRLQVSAEESWRTPKIIDAVVRLREVGVPVVATLQANLRRSASDLSRLVETSVPVRLVKGAYMEPSDVAHPWGEETDAAYVQLAHLARDGGGDLTLATHDPVITEALLPLYDEPRIEMLLGVRESDALDLLNRGIPVRIYVPYGESWFRYWTRRRAEALGS